MIREPHAGKDFARGCSGPPGDASGERSLQKGANVCRAAPRPPCAYCTADGLGLKKGEEGGSRSPPRVVPEARPPPPLSSPPPRRFKPIHPVQTKCFRCVMHASRFAAPHPPVHLFAPRDCDGGAGEQSEGPNGEKRFFRRCRPPRGSNISPPVPPPPALCGRPVLPRGPSSRRKGVLTPSPSKRRAVGHHRALLRLGVPAKVMLLIPASPPNSCFVVSGSNSLACVPSAARCGLANTEPSSRGSCHAQGPLVSLRAERYALGPGSSGAALEDGGHARVLL